MKFICPLCQSPLSLSENNKTLGCLNNHQFDRAKQGYYNLLPVQHKKSKQPGDSKEMIAARHDFLNADYYQPLAVKLAQVITQHLPSNGVLLDLGCGEGYYTRQLQSLIPGLISYGMDISKPAVVKAAAQDKQAHYMVASSDSIPLADSVLDAVLKVYAPANDSELSRVLNEQGVIISVMPGPRHLWQIREFIYDDVRAHDTQDTQFAGFSLASNQQFSFTICPNDLHRSALLQMTPFAWKANALQTSAIENAQGLTIELDFVINCYRRQVETET